MGACAMVAQDCFVSPTHPPLKQNTPLGETKGQGRPKLGQCNHVFMGHATQLTDSEKCQTLNAPICVEKK